MTARELMDQLSEFDGNEEVYFEYNYGDYWNNHVAESVGGVHTKFIKWSDYHNSNKIVDEDQVDEDEDNVSPAVVISDSSHAY